MHVESTRLGGPHNHRVVFVACPDDYSLVLKGTLNQNQRALSFVRYMSVLISSILVSSTTWYLCV
jgi:hypothetical protein